MRPDGGGSDTFQVTPQDLQNAAQNFYKASKDTTDLYNSLTKSTQQLVTELSSELSHSPDALQRLTDRWQKAMTSLSGAMNTVGKNLDAAASVYQQADGNVSQGFQNNGSGK